MRTSIHVPQNTHALLQSRANVYVAHTPSGTSVQNILHWSQVRMLNLYSLFKVFVQFVWKSQCSLGSPGVVSPLFQDDTWFCQHYFNCEFDLEHWNFSRYGWKGLALGHFSRLLKMWIQTVQVRPSQSLATSKIRLEIGFSSRMAWSSRNKNANAGLIPQRGFHRSPLCCRLHL